MKKTANLTLITGGKSNLSNFQMRQTKKKLEREAAEAKCGSSFVAVKEWLMKDMWGPFDYIVAVVAGTAAFIGLVLLIAHLPRGSG